MPGGRPHVANSVLVLHPAESRSCGMQHETGCRPRFDSLESPKVFQGRTRWWVVLLDPSVVSMRSSVALLAAFVLFATGLPGAAAATDGDRPDFDEIDSFVTDYLDRHGLAGASIAVVKDGHVLHTAGYGDTGENRGRLGDPDGFGLGEQVHHGLCDVAAGRCRKHGVGRSGGRAPARVQARRPAGLPDH